jgi:predicted PurR-regulated permease PerM
MTRHLIRIGAAVMTTLLALWVLYLLRSVLLYVLISLALAGAVTPLFNSFAGYKRPARLGMILVYLLALAGFIIFLLEVGGGALRDAQLLVDALSVQDVWQQPDWVQGVAVQQFLNDRLPPPSVLAATIAGERGQGLLSIFLGLTQGIFGLLSGLLVILFLSLYWSANRAHFQQLWLSLLPPAARKYARNTIYIAEHHLGHYIRVEFIQSLIVGLLLALGYWALGSPYPVLLAVIGALANLIPVVGVIIAIFTPLLIGLLSSLQISLTTALLTVLVLGVIKLWLKPRLYKRQQQQNPILTIFLVVALADAFGLMGIIAAPPLAAAIQILWDLWVSERSGTQAANEIAGLKERQAQLSAQIAAMHQPPPMLISSLERLNTLVERSEPVLRAQVKARVRDKDPGG